MTDIDTKCAALEAEKDALRERLAAMQKSMDEVRPFTDKIVARLASAEALLRMIRADMSSEWGKRWLPRIDAFLAGRGEA